MIQTGTLYFDQSSPGWNLNTGTGERLFKSPDIPFPMPYSALGPRPQMALTLRSIDSEGNLRVDVFPEDVQQEEFNIVIKTWGDGVLLQVFVTWIAFD